MDMNIKNYEDLIAWTKSAVLVKQIYLLTRQKQFCKFYKLSSRMQGVAVF
jgi:hypothetical protein